MAEKLHLNEPQDFWNNAVWTHKAKVWSWCTAPCFVNTRHGISAQTTHTNCQAQWWRGDGLELFSSQRTWQPYSHWVDYKSLCILQSSRVKYKTICPSESKVWLTLVHATEQRSTTFWLKKKRLKVLRWPNAVMGAVHKRKPPKPQWTKEEWLKILPQRC